MKKKQLLSDLQSGDAETAMEAAKAIISRKIKIDPSKIEEIARGTNQNVWSRIAAIYLLGNLRIRRSAPILAKILEETHEQPIIREYAAEALGNIGDSTFLPLISTVAKETTSPEIRKSCEFALEEIPAIEARHARSALDS